jgi:hypothetical protein
MVEMIINGINYINHILTIYVLFPSFLIIGIVLLFSFMDHITKNMSTRDKMLLFYISSKSRRR